MFRTEPRIVADSAPTLAKGWEIVSPRTRSERAPLGRGESSITAGHRLFKRDQSAPLPGPAPTSGSNRAARWLILRTDENIPLSRKIDVDITLVVNTTLFQQQALAQVLMMKAQRNPKGTLTPLTHQDANAEMALLSHYIII